MIDYPHLGDAKVAYVVCGLRVYEVRCHRGKNGIWTFLARDGRHLHPDPKNVSTGLPLTNGTGQRKIVFLREEERRAWGLSWVDSDWKVHKPEEGFSLAGKPMSIDVQTFAARVDALRKLSALAGEAERSAAQADKITAHACLFKAMVLREACDTLRVAWEESDKAEAEKDAEP